MLKKLKLNGSMKTSRPSRTNTQERCPFIIGDWNAKVGDQEIRGVTGRFGLRVQNEAGKRLIEFCQENTLVIADILFQQHKRRLDTWTSVSSVQFISVQSLSRVRLFMTPWIAAHQASLSITNSHSLLKLISIESVMPSNYLILCRPLLLNLSHHQGIFQWVNSSHEVAKVLDFQL